MRVLSRVIFDELGFNMATMYYLPKENVIPIVNSLVLSLGILAPPDTAAKDI
jgi:hypothetical protein